jgi:threonine dehydrogenase-like Zn-dependent dehydrogenase
MKRRKFIGGTATALAGLPFATLGQPAAVPGPKRSEIRVGIIGLGAMGRIHLEKLSQSARVVAICDVHQTRLYQAGETLITANCLPSRKLRPWSSPRRTTGTRG